MFEWQEQKTVLIAAAVVVVVLIVGVGIWAMNTRNAMMPEGSHAVAAASSSAAKSSEQAASSEEASDSGEAVPQKTSDRYELNPYDLANLPDADSVTMVNLSPGGEPAVLADDQMQAINAAVSTIEQNGRCGFVFLDADTGHGIVYNAADVMYIASASKAPLAYFALQQNASESDSTLGSIESAIVDSDNDSYESFGYQYFNDDYIRWLEGYGVDHNLYSGDLYPPMSARSLAAIWGEILSFIRGGSGDAQWFAGLLTETDRRFIGDALEGEGAVVMSKAGWITDAEFNAVADAGIIRSSDGTYIMVIISDQPAWQGGEEDEGALAATLYGLRYFM